MNRGLTATKRGRVISAVCAAVAVMGLLAGCLKSGPSADEIEAPILEEVLHIQGVTGALVHLSSAGLEGRRIVMKLWVGDVSTEVLATTLDLALEAAWKVSLIKAQGISIRVVDGPKPDNATMGGLNGVDLAAAAAILGIEANITHDALSVSSAVLADRYGAWQDPGSD